MLRSPTKTALTIQNPIQNPLNYQPISLTSVCGKTLEEAICEAIDKHLEQNALLSNDQFGFRQGWTVDDQLLLTYSFITLDLDNGKVIDCLI